jgi:hypothetical protein
VFVTIIIIVRKQLGSQVNFLLGSLLAVANLFFVVIRGGEKITANPLLSLLQGGAGGGSLSPPCF